MIFADYFAAAPSEPPYHGRYRLQNQNAQQNRMFDAEYPHYLGSARPRNPRRPTQAINPGDNRFNRTATLP